MGQDLKAENLAISIPSVGCDKNCPYCISRMTGYLPANPELQNWNLAKVLRVAEMAEVTSILFTGKGEPTLNMQFLGSIMQQCSTWWPLELQTNGIHLSKNLIDVDFLRSRGLNVLALSMDHSDQFRDYIPLIRHANDIELVVRITVNITNRLDKKYTFTRLINYCSEHRVRQLTLRKIVSPEIPFNLETAKWIEKNAPIQLYDAIVAEASQLIKTEGRLIRQLNNGVNIYDINDVSFSHSDYCIQEHSLGNNVRSLVFQEDGHLYTSWSSKASILF